MSVEEELRELRRAVLLLNGRVASLAKMHPVRPGREWMGIGEFVRWHYPERDWAAKARWIRRRIYPGEEPQWGKLIRARRNGRRTWEIRVDDARCICGVTE